MVYLTAPGWAIFVSQGLVDDLAPRTQAANRPFGKSNCIRTHHADNAVAKETCSNKVLSLSAASCWHPPMLRFSPVILEDGHFGLPTLSRGFMRRDSRFSGIYSSRPPAPLHRSLPFWRGGRHGCDVDRKKVPFHRRVRRWPSGSVHPKTKTGSRAGSFADMPDGFGAGLRFDRRRR